MHRDWIEIILKEYYDPMYNHLIEKKIKNILFKGNAEAVLEFLKSCSCGKVRYLTNAVR